LQDAPLLCFTLLCALKFTISTTAGRRIEGWGARSGNLSSSRPRDTRRAGGRGGGKLDLQTADTFEAALSRALEAAVDRVVVDLSAVTFMGFSGVSSLVSLTRGFREAGGSVLLAASPEQQISKLLRVCGLDRLLGVYPDAESAARG
jgi:anti-sigma B factor antagonist